MKLTLKNLNDEIMTVDVEGTDSIKKVKERIQNMEFQSNLKY